MGNDGKSLNSPLDSYGLVKDSPTNIHLLEAELFGDLGCIGTFYRKIVS